LAVKVEDPPGQIALADGEIVTAGFGFTVIVMLAVPVHPRLVPVTI
jgi:hypothetical protein